MQIAVTTKDGLWTVFQDGQPLIQGMSRSRAIEIAELLAFNAEENGDDVDLIVQGYTGELSERHSGGGTAT